MAQIRFAFEPEKKQFEKLDYSRNCARIWKSSPKCPWEFHGEIGFQGKDAKGENVQTIGEITLKAGDRFVLWRNKKCTGDSDDKNPRWFLSFGQKAEE